MRLAALVESPDHVCCRYRIRPFVAALADAGHVMEIRQIPKSLWERWQLGPSLSGVDGVIVQRKLLSVLEVNRLRRRVKTLLFDFDDAVWLRDSYSGKGLKSSKRERRFRAIVQASDCVIAGNQFLAAKAKEVGAKRVVVIPTCVALDQYPLATHSSEPVDLVWIGSSSTLQGLEEIKPLLETLGQQIPGIRLKLICDRFLQFQHLAIVECPWSSETERSDLANSSIGISWIPDDDWSRGKCGLKVLQYMAAGLPVVANDIGVHAEMIVPGQSGFLANRDEWVQAIRTLVGDRELRRRFGQHGHQRVETHYSVAAGSQQWLELVASLRTQRVAS